MFSNYNYYESSYLLIEHALQSYCAQCPDHALSIPGHIKHANLLGSSFSQLVTSLVFVKDHTCQ